jgi:hypothetical protein
MKCERRGRAKRAVCGLAACLALLAAMLAPAPARAHKPSDSYLSLAVQGARIEGRWDIALRDLEFALGLDANGDGDITWGELKAKHADIASYALARLSLKADGRDCPAVAGEQQVDRHSDGTYTVLRFAADCGRDFAQLEARYSLFFDFDTQHKGLLNLSTASGTQPGVFSVEGATQSFELARISAWRQFASFVREGVWHIWVGFDHILFIVSLLLPAVLVHSRRRWLPAERFMPAFWDVARVVTSFTVAHSITLSLAALGVISLPSRLVECTIAASVVLAALNNIFPVVLRRRWMVAFAFGLVHGFGFASVLADLGLPQNALLLALVGFNAGVEIGQLVIVSLFLPVAFVLRSTPLYRHVLMTGGSAAVALLALVWFCERAFNFKIMPF